MISTFGWIFVVFILIVLSIIFCILKDSNTYKNRECYDRSVYKCLNCNQKSCKYHVITNKIDKLDRRRKMVSFIKSERRNIWVII